MAPLNKTYVYCYYSISFSIELDGSELIVKDAITDQEVERVIVEDPDNDPYDQFVELKEKYIFDREKKLRCNQ
jgi:hypothetical protein